MTPEFTFQPTPVFRGSRDYYHSTDLYQSLASELERRNIRADSFDLTIRDKIINKPKVEFYRSESPPLSVRPAAIARFKIPGDSLIAIVSSNDSPIVQSKQYDESQIFSYIVRNGNKFEVSECNSFSPIEIVTAVAVFAHRTLYPPLDNQRWLLARICCGRMLSGSIQSRCKVEVSRQLNPRLVESKLIDNSGVFGTLLFILSK